jgi:hypothetical protein
MIRDEKGVVLVGAVAAMIFSALFVTVAANMQIRNTLQLDQSLATVETYASAQGISNWYRQLLNGDSDWSDNGPLAGTVNGIDVTITVNSSTTDELNYTVTSTKSTEEGLYDVTRSVTQTVERMSPVLQNFSLFVDYTGARLRLRSNSGIGSTVTGNVYGGGGGDVDSGNTQTGGVFFIRNGESFSGDAGTKRGKTLASAATPTFPVLDDSSYQTIMDGYDDQLATLSGTKNNTVNNKDFDVVASNKDCTDDATYGVVCDFDRFRTQGGTVNITGNGTIRCDSHCQLHSTNQSSGNTLNVIPDDGGSITFLAKENLQIGRNDDDTIIYLNTSSTGSRTVNLYSQATSATNRFVNIRGQTTNLGSATNENAIVNIYSRRRVAFNDGAQMLGKQNLIFIDDAADHGPLNSTTNNLIQIIGDSSKSRPTLVEGAAISSGCRYASDCIRFAGGYSGGSNTHFNGLLYQYDSTNTGECDIDDAEITGVVVCYRLQGNQVRRTNITWDPDVLPDTIPAGFDFDVRRKINTGDGI